MTINAKQFREFIVRPTLKYLEPEIPYSTEAEDLLVMTAAHESHLGTYLKQVNGPALGVYQMERETEKDICFNFLLYRNELAKKVSNLCFSEVEIYTGLNETIGNLFLATAMARVHYYRDKEAIPKEKDYPTRSEYIDVLGAYAKRVYNTELGKATAKQYVKDYLKYGV